MRRVFAAFGFFALAGALVMSFLLVPEPLSASSDRPATFLIPPGDGYGIAHCILSGDICGEVVAGAWCESHGFARAESFGAASPVNHTGSLAAIPVASRDRGVPLSITCSD